MSEDTEKVPQTFVAEWLNTNLKNPDLDGDIMCLIARFTRDDVLDVDGLKSTLEDPDED